MCGVVLCVVWYTNPNVPRNAYKCQVCFTYHFNHILSIYFYTTNIIRYFLCIFGQAIFHIIIIIGYLFPMIQIFQAASPSYSLLTGGWFLENGLGIGHKMWCAKPHPTLLNLTHFLPFSLSIPFPTSLTTFLPLTIIFNIPIFLS